METYIRTEIMEWAKEKLRAGEITKELFLVTDREAATSQRQTILGELNDLAKDGEIML